MIKKFLVVLSCVLLSSHVFSESRKATEINQTEAIVMCKRMIEKSSRYGADMSYLFDDSEVSKVQAIISDDKYWRSIKNTIHGYDVSDDDGSDHIEYQYVITVHGDINNRYGQHMKGGANCIVYQYSRTEDIFSKYNFKKFEPFVD